MTDETWSSPRLLVPEERMREVAAFRPQRINLDFGVAKSTMLGFVDKFESWSETLPEGCRPADRDGAEWL